VIFRVGDPFGNIVTRELLLVPFEVRNPDGVPKGVIVDVKGDRVQLAQVLTIFPRDQQHRPRPVSAPAHFAIHVAADRLKVHRDGANPVRLAEVVVEVVYRLPVPILACSSPTIAVFAHQHDKFVVGGIVRLIRLPVLTKSCRNGIDPQKERREQQKRAMKQGFSSSMLLGEITETVHSYKAEG